MKLTGETAQQLNVFAALPEDLVFLSTYKVALTQPSF